MSALTDAGEPVLQVIREPEISEREAKEILSGQFRVPVVPLLSAEQQPQQQPSLCDSCQRLYATGKSCSAYPHGIPQEIIFFGQDHRVPLPGDHGLQYVHDARKAAARRRWLIAHPRSGT